MSTDPDEIRRDIERTRANLSDDVNALADSANPKNIVSHQVDRAKDAAVGLKEKVFGSDDDYADDGLVGNARDAVQGRVDDARYAVGQTVDQGRAQVDNAGYQVKRRTRGNPLAAGLVAFGLGALVAGLMPASEKEKQAVDRLKTEAQPLADHVQAAAQESVQNLKPAVQDAVQEVKEHAQDSVDRVKEQASSAKDDVVDQAQASKDNLTGQAQESKDNITGQAQASKDNLTGQVQDSKDRLSDDPHPLH